MANLENFVVFDHAPRSGPPGTVVRLYGAALTAAEAKWTRSAETLAVKALSDSELEITIPKGAAIGTSLFTIQTPSAPGLQAVLAFTVN